MGSRYPGWGEVSLAEARRTVALARRVRKHVRLLLPARRSQTEEKLMDPLAESRDMNSMVSGVLFQRGFQHCRAFCNRLETIFFSGQWQRRWRSPGERLLPSQAEQYEFYGNHQNW